jgi:predicted kinase
MFKLISMSHIFLNINNAELRPKMASFDYDWTLVNPKDGKTFPSSIDDWVWLYPNIPTKLIEYYQNGYPGSGKTTIADNICKNDNYIRISGDIYKTTSKMKKASLEYILQQKSIIFDATHSSIKKRLEFINFGNKHKYEIKCVHVTTSLEISYKRNKIRNDEKQVPKIAYSVYKKYYEEPTEIEGFKLFTI